MLLLLLLSSSSSSSSSSLSLQAQDDHTVFTRSDVVTEDRKLCGSARMDSIHRRRRSGHGIGSNEKSVDMEVPDFLKPDTTRLVIKDSEGELARSSGGIWAK